MIHDGAFQVVTVLGGVDWSFLHILLQLGVGPSIRILITLLSLQMPEVFLSMHRNDAIPRLSLKLGNVSVHLNTVVFIELVTDFVEILFMLVYSFLNCLIIDNIFL
jgi:hypothetical protein